MVMKGKPGRPTTRSTTESSVMFSEEKKSVNREQMKNIQSNFFIDRLPPVRKKVIQP